MVTEEPICFMCKHFAFVDENGFVRCFVRRFTEPLDSCPRFRMR